MRSMKNGVLGVHSQTPSKSTWSKYNHEQRSNFEKVSSYFFQGVSEVGRQKVRPQWWEGGPGLTETLAEEKEEEEVEEEVEEEKTRLGAR